MKSEVRGPNDKRLPGSSVGTTTDLGLRVPAFTGRRAVVPLLLLLLARSLAAGPGNEVVVVYNKRLPESKNLAEYYARQRQVPANQVFGFDLPTAEDISRAEFRDRLQQPLAKALESNKLWRVGSRAVPAATNRPAHDARAVVESKIRFAALCYGIPLRILPDPNLKEPGLENLRPELRRNEAAVDSELAVLPLVHEDIPLAGPLRNPVFAATNSARLHPTNGVLMVTRLDGPSPEIARGLVDKALQAEATGLWGRAYFDLRNTTEPAYKMGDDWIRRASEFARLLGFETVVDENPATFPAGFPMSHIALYAGWYSQDACGPFAQPNVEFMPGAFAYHLHSYSAPSLRSTNRFWAGPLLAKGATITMGCVDEPYLACTPEIAIFIGRFTIHAFTFGEAAYACQPVLSWQTTVIGDPLYRPFAKNPDDLHRELEQRHSDLVAWYFVHVINLNLARGRPAGDGAAFLEQLDLTRQSACLTEKLGDLYLAQGKPSSAVHEYRLALKLHPSPQQHIRLLLTLGEKLIALGAHEEEAYAQYQELLRLFPDYPDKLTLYRTLLPLAQKLHKTADAETYAAILQPSHPAPATNPPAPGARAGTNK